MRRRERSRGAILVAVLWAIALLSGLAMAASTTFRSFAGIVTVHRDRLRADALLTAGLEVAAGVVRRLALEDIPVREVASRVALPGGAVQFRLNDEGGKIDVGRAPPELLAALFASLRARDPEGIAKRIVAWRAPEGEDGSAPAPQRVQDESRPPEPAPAAAGEQPFSDVRQLANVAGVPAAVVAAAAPFLTVFGNATVNPLTAPPEVIAALPGMDASRARGFLELRRRFPADSARLEAALAAAQPHLAASPQRVISVELTATLEDGFTANAVAVIVVFLDDAEPYRILAWNPLGSRRESVSNLPK